MASPPKSSTCPNSLPPIFTLAAAGGSSGCTESVSPNFPHASADKLRLTLMLKKALAKSVPGYEFSGRTTAAAVTPPGSIKFIPTGPKPFQSSLASSPVFRVYFLGYWNEIPEATSLYVTVEGRFFTTLFATGFSLTARIGVTTGLTVDELDGWLELGVETRVPSFDLEQPTAPKLIISSKPAASAAIRLPLDA